MLLSRIVYLALIIVPWIAAVGGGVLALLAALHLLSRLTIPHLPHDKAFPALAATLLGVGLCGLGATYIVTAGSSNYGIVYAYWLAVCVLAGIATLIGDRVRN